MLFFEILMLKKKIWKISKIQFELQNGLIVRGSVEFNFRRSNLLIPVDQFSFYKRASENMLFGRTALRQFSGSIRLLNDVAKKVTVSAASVVKAEEVVNSVTMPINLYLEPRKWKGLKSEQIFQLYKERMVKLGSAYKQSPEELEALLSTSQDSGVSPTNIRKLYYNGEQGAIDISGGKMKESYDALPFQYDELPSPAQDLVEQHREQRFYNRLAAYELPLLARFRQEYEKVPEKTHPVSYRFTTYIGEEHPNSRKVVLQVKSKNLGLDSKQLHKFQILAKTRYDHVTDIFKMSSDKFPESFQNAHYLNNVFQKLVAEAKDVEKEDFCDIPLDTRHITAKNLRKKKHNYQFPDEWKRPQDAPKETLNIVKEIERIIKSK